MIARPVSGRKMPRCTVPRLVPQVSTRGERGTGSPESAPVPVVAKARPQQTVPLRGGVPRPHRVHWA